MLRVDNIQAYYGTAHILDGTSLEVNDGEVLGLLGRNGMGKTTLVRTIAGIDPPQQHSGTITWQGEDITHLESYEIARRGIGYVPQGRRIFGSLTVVENLEVIARKPADGVAPWDVERVFGFFPRLGERKESVARTLSGGEQQMLAIGRALMADPKLLILDEPSLGLAPMLIEQIRDIIVGINEQGTSVLLIEQNAMMALSIAAFGYVMESGKVVMDGPAKKLLDDEDVQEFYLGLGGEGGARKSFRDVKHYKRRKRWLS